MGKTPVVLLVLFFFLSFFIPGALLRNMFHVQKTISTNKEQGSISDEVRITE